MNEGRAEEIEMVAAQLHRAGQYVPAVMLRELLVEVRRLTAQNTALRSVLTDVPIDAIMALYDNADPLAAYNSVGEWLLDAAAVTVENAAQAGHTSPRHTC
jgi:propanediol dehydratase small subunit